MLPFVLSVVDPATARSEKGEENTERAALLPYPGFRSFGTVVNLAKTPPDCQNNSPQAQIAASSSGNELSVGRDVPTSRAKRTAGRYFGKLASISEMETVSTDDGVCPGGLAPVFHLFRRDWRNPYARLFGGFAPDFPHYSVERNLKNENLYCL